MEKTIQFSLFDEFDEFDINLCQINDFICHEKHIHLKLSIYIV